MPPPDLTDLPGVGPARLKALNHLGVETLDDLLHYFPRDYQYESAQALIKDLQPNTIATAQGEVIAANYIPGPRPRFEATLSDGTGKLALTFFHGAYLRTRIHPGMQLKVRGKLRVFRNLPQMQNPKWSPVKEDAPIPEEATAKAKSRLTPLYPATAALNSDALSKLIEQALPLALEQVHESLPLGLLGRREIVPRKEAYQNIHFPASKADAIAARKRLVYDELLTMQLGLLLSRQRTDGKLSAPILRVDKTLDARIRSRFPFPFTDAQLRATYELLNDLGSGRAMNRLLQGDVGSGKTAVALYAMLVAVANKMQAVILAPTEVLAEQHYLTLSRFLASSSVTIELFTSRTKRQSRGSLTRALAEGKIHLAVGTQALLQQDIDFANLGLVVVDEQHRLGVQQRATLRGKGLAPHYLVMTATPIPRTLALSYFADFDLSVIDELPPGRTPITTQLIATKDQNKAWSFLKTEVACGRQAYIVVPKIGSDPTPSPFKPEVSAVEDPSIANSFFPDEEQSSVLAEHKRLKNGPLKGLNIATLHGAMSPEEKQATMESFRKGESNVLLATTVIEVGIDVPNATTIVILNAEQFGLSQLHQLRGRVGRGEHASHCLLLSDAASGAGGDADDHALSRLTALTKTTSGFEIAELDLQLRGPGQFFGTRQHGLPEFRLADLTSETHLLQDAREDAQWILQRDPKLLGPELKVLRAEIQKKFADVLPLASVG